MWSLNIVLALAESLDYNRVILNSSVISPNAGNAVQDAGVWPLLSTD